MATTTTSSSTALLAALSASGSHVAVVVPTNNNNNSLLRIQVFQTNNGTLQTTLTHRNNGTTASSSSLPREIFWSGNDKICLLTSSQQVLVFDLTRGVLAHTIAPGKDQILHHAAAATTGANNGILQVLVSSSSSLQESGSSDGKKIQIHEYDASSGKLIRKIKAGSLHHHDVDHKKNSVASLGLAVTTDYFIIRQDNQLRIIKSDTGEKVTKKCKLSKKGEMSLPSSNNDDAAVVGSTIAMGQLGAAVVSSSRQVVLVNLKIGKVTPSSALLPVVSSSSLNNNSLQLWETASAEESSLYYLYHDKVLYKLQHKDSSCSSDNKTHNNVVEVKSKRKIQINSSIEKQTVLGHGNDIVAVLYKAGQIQIDKIPLVVSSSEQQDEDNVTVTWHDPESVDKNNTATTAGSSNTKRKSTTATQVLGPGQAGGESRIVSEGPQPPAPKRAKKETIDDKKEGSEDDMNDGSEEEEDDEGNEGPTIAERLQKLEQALLDEEQDDHHEQDEEGKSNSKTTTIKFHPKKVTTESLTLVLEQALQSNDKAMLELALTVTNQRILQTTCASLSSESLIQLLSALTTRLAQKPSRAVQLSYWLTVVLKSGRLIQNNNHNNIGQLLQPLRNLLDERVELFPTFYKLRGRLGMMGNLQE